MELRKAIKTRSIQVSERHRLDKPEGIRELAEADAVLTCRCWEQGDKLAINANIVENSTSAALSSADVMIPKDRVPANLPYLPANFQQAQQTITVWNDVSSPDSKLDVKI